MRAATMRAVRLHRVGRDPEVQDVPIPEPGRGQVRVAMKACGVCGSDLHIIEGSTVARQLPVTLGHEPAGVVDAVGPGVPQPHVGEPVVVNSMISCGRCRPCRRGDRNLCARLELMGVEVDGAHAEYFLAPAENCVTLPGGIDFSQGAVVTDAVATPLHAIRRAGVRPGDTVAVFGIGGLGTHAVMLLRQVFDAHVIAVDTDDRALARAAAHGAATTIDGHDARVARTLVELSDGGVDVAFDFVGSVPVVEQGLRALRPGGRCVAVGVVPERLALSLRQETLVARELALIGSLGFHQSEIQEVLNLVAAGRLDLEGGISHLFPINDYAEGLAVLRHRSAEVVRVVVTNE